MTSPRVYNPLPQRVNTNMTGQLYSVGDPGTSIDNCTIVGLEELVNESFEHSLNILMDQKRVKMVERFEDLIARLHCDESLKFLIEIFKYEFFYEKALPYQIDQQEEKLNSLSSRRNSQDMLFHMISSPDLPSIGISKRSRSASLKSEYLEPTSVFVSSIDDLGSTESGLQRENTNAWDVLRDKFMDDEQATLISLDEIEQDDLIQQWNYIIENYIKNDAPEQINLSDNVYSDIMKENSIVGLIHKPTVLIPAKKEILRLLKENVYVRFMNEEKKSANVTPEAVPTNTNESHVLQNGIALRIETPTLSPSISNNTASTGKSKKKKSRILQISSPITTTYNEDESSNSASSSFSNILGHLRLNGSAPTSTLHSLSNSPLEEKPSSYKLSKLWKKKKDY